MSPPNTYLNTTFPHPFPLHQKWDASYYMHHEQCRSKNPVLPLGPYITSTQLSQHASGVPSHACMSRGQLCTEGVYPLLSILIQQICHKSFYKCSMGGYRNWWKCPIQPACAPMERQHQRLVDSGGVTASDHPAICGVGWLLFISLFMWAQKWSKIRK